MNMASLELSRELYKLSNWSPDEGWINDNTSEEGAAPQYSLGYLLTKIAADGTTLDNELILKKSSLDWVAMFQGITRLDDQGAANAVCRLAIELWKSGVLK